MVSRTVRRGCGPTKLIDRAPGAQRVDWFSENGTRIGSVEVRVFFEATWEGTEGLVY